MTYLEVAYRYQTSPGEAELRAIDSVREVYGIQCIQFNEKGQSDYVGAHLPGNVCYRPGRASRGPRLTQGSSKQAS